MGRKTTRELEKIQERKDIIAKRKVVRGQTLAKLYFLEGKTKYECTMAVFPKMSEATAKSKCTEVFHRYKVHDAFLSMMPSETDPMIVEKMLHHLKVKSLDKDDSKLTLEVLDRYGKLMGKWKQDINVKVSRSEEWVNRVEKAQKILDAEAEIVQEPADQ